MFWLEQMKMTISSTVLTKNYKRNRILSARYVATQDDKKNTHAKQSIPTVRHIPQGLQQY